MPSARTGRDAPTRSHSSPATRSCWSSTSSPRDPAARSSTGHRHRCGRPSRPSGQVHGPWGRRLRADPRARPSKMGHTWTWRGPSTGNLPSIATKFPRELSASAGTRRPPRCSFVRVGQRRSATDDHVPVAGSLVRPAVMPAMTGSANVMTAEITLASSSGSRSSKRSLLLHVAQRACPIAPWPSSARASGMSSTCRWRATGWLGWEPSQQDCQRPAQRTFGPGKPPGEPDQLHRTPAWAVEPASQCLPCDLAPFEVAEADDVDEAPLG
jgi:hypothetical protein